MNIFVFDSQFMNESISTDSVLSLDAQICIEASVLLNKCFFLSDIFVLKSEVTEHHVSPPSFNKGAINLSVALGQWKNL